MKKLILTFSFLLSSILIYGAQRSFEQMITAAKRVVKVAPAATRSGAAQMKMLKQGSQFTVLGYDSGGFAVIANDDRFNAVLAYSDDRFSADNIAPGMQWWMNAVDEALQSKLESGEPAAVGAELRDESLPESVPVLLSTTWGQETPYNNKIVEISGTNYPTGCVATAMAQLMKYYEYPVTGHGFKGYSIGGNHINVNFAAAPYQWENMLSSYPLTPGSYSDAQADAVAELMLHCGVAVDMQYNTDASGAKSNDAAIAMREYFKYSTDFYMRDIYTTEEWMSIIKRELSNGRPILYGGFTTQMAGHAFVFDGYDENNNVHVNWGWNGIGNGYYNVAILDSPSGTYSEMQDMIIAIPEEGGLPYSSQWGIMAELTWISSSGQQFTTTGKFDVSVSDNLLSFECSNLINCDIETFTGQLSMFAENINGGQPVQLVTASVNNVEYNNAYPENAKDYVGTADISMLADGTYRVYLASKATTETEWQPVRSNESITNNYILTISNGTAAVTAGEPGWTTGIQGIEAAGTDGDGTVRVYTADGVLVYTSPADSFSIDDVPARGLLIVKNGANTTKIMK